jgi:hypothetical protein
MNPKKDTIGSAKFVEMHTLFGDAPVTSGADEFAQYEADLVAVRNILVEAYEFNQENAENW